MKILIPIGVLLLSLVSQAADRPKIGLVLGGGGARGAAHIGVLEELERQRIPVDCVAGTSFGALVAGAWAAGISPGEMRRAMSLADWDDMFQDNPDYNELNPRYKRQLQRYLPGSEAGIASDGVTYPPGAVSGQKIQLFINQLVRADRGQRRIEALPLPLSIVATDLGSGERVVFREGDLTQAMRASMAVPGIVAPLELDGRKLVDGGLVDNLPVREVRERCGAEVVIAVNVGSPLLAPQEIGSLLSVSAQMVLLLTEQNVTQSLQRLGERDIYLRPVLDGISSGDFGRFETAAARGREATGWVADALASLALPEPLWAARQQSLKPEREGAPQVAAIRIDGLERVQPEVVARHIGQPLGRPLDTTRLERDLLRSFGDGWYEKVNYSLVEEPAPAAAEPGTASERRILRITPAEKSWGPDYLRFALNFDSTLSQGSTFGLRAAVQRTWLNRLGGELIVGGEIGSRQALELQWHQPLEPSQRWFAQLDLGVSSGARDLYVRNQAVARYDVRLRRGELSLGSALGRLGELRLGLLATRGEASLDVGTDLIDEAVLDLLDGSGRGLAVTLDLDQMDRLYFPTRGWSARLQWYRDSGGLYAKLTGDLRAAMPLRDWVLGAQLAYTGSPTGVLPLFEAGTLGGFLNLSAYARGQFVADTVQYAHLRAERIIGRLPLGLRGDMRLGLALEGGQATNTYTVGENIRRLNSVAIYLGGETPFGPVYVGVGHTGEGSANAYLFLGTP
jgi:NTE family protein